MRRPPPDPSEDSSNVNLKEHIAWTAPFLATSAFLLALYYGPRIITRPWLRAALIVMVVAALGAATIGGGFGTFINKVAPIV